MGIRNHSNLVILLLFAILLVLSSFLCHFYLPSIVQNEIEKRLKLTPNSDTFIKWKDVTVPIYFSIYLFNITNSDDILTKESAPVFEEIGPYTFSEARHRVNISWILENGTISYKERKVYNFIPNLSSGSLDDPLIHLNPTIVATGNDIKRNQAEDLIYNSINAIITSADLELYPKHKVDEVLFTGYLDDLLHAAQELQFNLPFDRFGYFYKKNNTVSKNLFTIFSGQKGMDKFGLMNKYNNKEDLNYWQTDECNSIEKSSPGDFQPPFKKSDIIYLFFPELCRSVPLTFLKEVTHKGLKLHRYWLSDKVFDYDEQANRCYCTNTSCPLKGLFNASSCTLGSPIFISLPHFLFTDPEVTKNLIGLNADEDRHLFYIDFEPDLNVPVNVKARLQINMLAEKDENLELLDKLPYDQIYFPIFWTETSCEADEEIIKQLKLIQNIPSVLAIVVFAQLIIASMMLIIAFCKEFQNYRKINNRKCSYESIKIHQVKIKPQIRKMSSDLNSMKKETFN